MRFKFKECEILTNTHYSDHGHKLLLSHKIQIFYVPDTEIKGQFFPVKWKYKYILCHPLLCTVCVYL